MLLYNHAGCFSCAGDRERGSRKHQRPARRAAAPLDDRVVARLRSAGQLFRPGKLVGLSRCASFCFRHHHRSVWLPAERLQLDLCTNATSFRRIAGPLGVRQIGRISTLLWSVASFGAASATGLKSFLAARLLLGVGEAPTFPGNSKAVGYWFPARERSLATACLDSAAKLGPATGQPLLGLLLLRFGWRWSFTTTGFLSLIYFALFYWIYRNPI